MRAWVVAVAYALLVCAVDAPALMHAWWYGDDYPCAARAEDWAQRGLQNGRPIESLWLQTYALDPPPDHRATNVLLRLVGLALHIAAACAVATILKRYLSEMVAALAALPFLLSAVHIEPVLWRVTGGTYPLAALLGILGAAFITKETDQTPGRRATGAALCAVAILANQSAACAALVLWLGTIALRAAKGLARRRARDEALWLGGAFATGGAVSLACARLCRVPLARSQLARDPLARLQLLLDLDRWFLGASSLVITALNLIVIALALMAISRATTTQSRAAATALAALAAVLVAPYAMMLATTETWAPFRVFYAAPLGLGLLWAAGMQNAKSRGLQIVSAAALLALVLAQGLAAHAIAGETMTRYQRDLASVEQIRARGISRVAVADVAALDDPDPLSFVFGDWLLPALRVRWVWPSLLRLHGLRPADSASCAALAQNLPRSTALRFLPLPDGSLCVVPP